jgi:hypothetical protein
MSSVDYEGSPRAATPETFTADDGEMPLTDDIPGSSSSVEETVPGIDLTGATISHEWSALPTYTDGTKSKSFCLDNNFKKVNTDIFLSQRTKP